MKKLFLLAGIAAVFSACSTESLEPIGATDKNNITLEFENRKLSLKSTNDRILASKEVKGLILSLNEIYKVNNDQAIMDIMKRLTTIKRKVESRLKTHVTI